MELAFFKCYGIIDYSSKKLWAHRLIFHELLIALVTDVGFTQRPIYKLYTWVWFLTWDQTMKYSCHIVKGAYTHAFVCFHSYKGLAPPLSTMYTHVCIRKHLTVIIDKLNGVYMWNRRTYLDFLSQYLQLSLTDQIYLPKNKSIVLGRHNS